MTAVASTNLRGTKEEDEHKMGRRKMGEDNMVE
jgi:hypothetical protein